MKRKDKRTQEEENSNLPSVVGTRRNLRKQSKSKKKRIPIIIGKVLIVVILFAVLGVVVYGVKMMVDANKFLNDSYQPRETAVIEEQEKIDVQKEPISILLLGLDDNDERDIGSARTDSMILVTLNPQEELVSLVSIPRDTYTTIEAPGYQGKDKINAAFAHGGIDTTIETVSNLMDVPINFYATADFQAFEDIVDALGGVEIDVPFTLTEQNAKGEKVVDLKEGRHNLNGEEALAFARTRYVDNDVERGKRQQQVLEAIAQKAMSAGSIAKYKSILNALDGHITTDMPSNKILSVAQSGLTKDYKFDSYVFSWMSYDYMPYGEPISMVGLHQDSIDYISHRLRRSLDLDEPDERDEPGFVFESNGIIDPGTYPTDGYAVDN
ncbi:LCP family protein [Vagococcus jeotgali]|uniref:LCP family protein n=1 Tax=Vagococcus jeotgali TaxID=3109030 RepID=UPI002DD7BAE5|nr:LCP family protein [Vagococcus sp. B2T-5]